jgi:chromosome segregation ATPase
VQALEALTEKLTGELEQAKREGDLRTVECEGLRHDMRALQQRLDASREIQARLEMENHQQADELDIAKDKVNSQNGVGIGIGVFIMCVGHCCSAECIM